MYCEDAFGARFDTTIWTMVIERVKLNVFKGFLMLLLFRVCELLTFNFVRRRMKQRSQHGDAPPKPCDLIALCAGRTSATQHLTGIRNSGRSLRTDRSWMVFSLPGQHERPQITVQALCSVSLASRLLSEQRSSTRSNPNPTKKASMFEMRWSPSLDPLWCASENCCWKH